MLEQVQSRILELLWNQRQPSPHELVEYVEQKLGLEARWDITEAVTNIIDQGEVTRAVRAFLRYLIDDGTLAAALRGEDAPDRELVSTIDRLFEQSQLYRSSEKFQEMIEFVGRFRSYAPYNCMLVKVQNPSCGFFATEKNWQKKFNRQIIEDARPMLILAPRHPVMLVYDLDQTEGPELPKKLTDFAHFEGSWEERWLNNLVKSAEGHRIRVAFKTLSSTHGGFAAHDLGHGEWKRRIVVHDQLDSPSKFGVLCHELAHVLLGHLGSDGDRWWPSRTNLSHHAVEVEAEAVAWIITTRYNLNGSSAAYVSNFLTDGVPSGVSLDNIAKAAGHIDRMTKTVLPQRRPRAKRKKSKSSD